MLLDHIYQGSCIEVLKTLPDRSVDLVFADPPYNLQLQNDLWRPNMTLVDAVDDEWDKFGSFEEYDRFTKLWLIECRRVLKDTGTIWVIGSYHNIYRIGSIMQEIGFWFLNDVIWIRTNPMPQFRGVRFTNAHETLLWCKKSRDQKKYTFNYHVMKLFNDGKQMRSDWYLPICNGAERLRVNGEKLHSTQKPEALLYRVILSSSEPGDIVLDPFFGTGTSGVVAKRLGRRYIGIEKEERYVNAALARLESVEAVSSDKEVLGLITTKRNTRRIPFSALLERGLLLPGQVLLFDQRSEKVATILADSSLRTKDGVKGSIHQVGSYFGGTPSCNGWEHWYYSKFDGSLEVIDVLREQLRQEEVQ